MRKSIQKLKKSCLINLIHGSLAFTCITDLNPTTQNVLSDIILYLWNVNINKEVGK